MPIVRTRFAPSPTGYMHIGGMRTALFSWLWARHHGGEFVLRIDDTDRSRNIDEALQPILQAFRWLGLDWDEGPEVGGPYGPYFQSERGTLYRTEAEKLLNEGRAYRDFDPPDQIKADREDAEREGRNYLNIRRSLDLTEPQIGQYLEKERPFVVRFLVPRDEKIVLEDAVRGRVEWEGALMPDPVILRGDGSPLYNFATVVDDAQMHISIVIRAEEHLSNTPVQLFLQQALGYEPPQYAHIPYVAAPASKEKLSKRESKLDKYRRNPQFKAMFEAADRVFPQLGLGSSETLNPVMVEYYEHLGYLPHAVFNALARFGWSLDDKTEIMSRQTIIESFTLQRVVKSPAGFDPDKLMSFQTHWMGQLSLEEKVAACLPYLVRAGMLKEESEPASVKQVPGPRSDVRDYLARLLTALGDRLKVFSDILDYGYFFLPDEELTYDEKAYDKRLRKAGESAELLRAFRERLAQVEPFDAVTTDKLLHDFADAKQIKIGNVIHALRVAVTGQPKGPGMFDCLELLGRDRCLNRIDRALARL